ncbi:MAG: glycosyltransferase family 39 protein [bacterium]|nr:glycosyltransferase family 39 protein [bacterium]
MTISKNQWLFVIVTLGIIIRLTAAYLQPAFLDEAFVYYTSKADIDQILSTLKLDVHPPTYNILIHPLAQISSSIFILRLPSLLCDIISILLTFQLVRRFFKENESLAITALYAFSYAVWISNTQLRTYGPLTMLLMLILIGLLDINDHGLPFFRLKFRPAIKWLSWLACALGAASLHLLGAMSLAAFIILALFMPRLKRRTCSILVISILPVSLWFICAKSPVTANHVFSMSWARFTDFFTIPASLFNLQISILTPSPLELCYFSLSQWFEYILSFISSIILWYFWALGWKKLNQEFSWTAALLGCSLLFAPLFLFLYGIFTGSANSQSRYAIPMSIPFYILVFYGIKDHIRQKALFLALAVNMGISIIFPFQPQLWNQNWGPTLNFIDKSRHPGDVIIVYPYYTSFSLAMAYDAENINFLFPPQHSLTLIQKNNPAKLPIVPVNPQTFPYWLSEHHPQRLILIMCQEQYDRYSGMVISQLDQQYKLTAEHHYSSLREWARINTYILERKTK